MSDIHNSPLNYLSRVIPFRFLGRRARVRLSGQSWKQEFAPGQIIMHQGDVSDTRVYVLVEGQAEIRDPRNDPNRRVSLIGPGHYFGEWEALFVEPRNYEIRSVGRSLCIGMSGEDFLAALRSSRRMALSLGTILRDRQRIFDAFEEFKLELQRNAAKGRLSIAGLIPLYEKLEPALHPGVANPRTIDTTALTYAVRRLPENVTSQLHLLLTYEIPPEFSEPDTHFSRVASSARRRDIWQMIPGKSLVLLRNGQSDLTDLVTCLCLYAVEARKIRRRLLEASGLDAIRTFLSSGAEDDPGHGQSAARLFLDGLPFSQAEADGLCAVWPDDTVSHLHDIVRSGDTQYLSFYSQQGNYNSRRVEAWTNRLALTTAELIGYDPADLPDDYPVFVISSNTHSVTNCLNPWYTKHEDEVLGWIQEHADVGDAAEWRHQRDRLYAGMKRYFAQNPHRADDRLATGRTHGILDIRETLSTGIQVQLIDLSALARDDIDPTLKRQWYEQSANRRGVASSVEPESRMLRGLVVNIDYAFGEQAQHVMRNLVMLFGKRIRSVNFLGKAGSLVGARGDVLCPSAFIQQSSESYLPVPPTDSEALTVLKEELGDPRVHSGPLLTVDGTLLQNRLMLHFYRNIWQAIGMEMEGVHYGRQVQEAIHTGLLRESTRFGYYYYVSDLPLESGSNLAAPMTPLEGVPPLYAITRAVLSSILADAEGS